MKVPNQALIVNLLNQIPVFAAYFNFTLEANLVIVDWEKLCWKWNDWELLNPVLLMKYYVACIRNLDVVGKRAAEFILWLQSLGIAKANNVHVIGWSLGGQLAGRIGRKYQQLRSDGRKLARVTALDPAGPLFNLPPIYLDQVTKKGDALFVDVYHSNVGIQGEFLSDGDVDVYCE